ncbi:MAG TPA: AAA family ATPase [Solirubrobacteraceae bacterium]|nr:AAA family ATPase [Solirubrobacteraceae bacterium]
MSSRTPEGLLEREAELERVARLLDAANRRTGAVVVVEGPPGIGKSELLAAVRRLAEERGFAVLAARGSEFEAEMAFGVARQLFEPMLRGSSTAQRRQLTRGAARMGARALGVEIGEPPADRFAAIHGLYWLCANRAEQGPLVVVVDDAQWVDDPSLAWLGYLGRRTPDLALLLVLGLRSGDPGTERVELVRLLADDAVHRIAPRALSAAAVAAVVRAQLDDQADDEFCAACCELTRGNPLFVRELLVAARAEGLRARGASVPALNVIAPPAVGPSVLARLGRMGPEVVALARAVAVLGTGAEVVVAAELAELGPAAAELTADRLAAAQIFAPTRPLEFFHPLIAAAVVQDLAPGARRLAHRRAAALADRTGSLSRVAAHLLACGPAGDGWVVEQLSAAAGEALDRGAPEVAAAYLRRALAEPADEEQRAQLLLALGTAEWRARQPQAITHLEQAFESAGEDPAAWFDASWLLALAYIVSDRAERAVAVFERMRAGVADGDPRLALTLEASIALVGMGNERTAATALARAEDLRRRFGAVEDPPRHLLIMLASYAARANDAREAQELTERALAARPYPPPRELSIALIYLLTMVERYDAVQCLSDDLIAAARRQGAMQELLVLFSLRSWASAERGDLADAEAEARWALDHARGVGNMQAVSAMLRVLVERDALDEAEHVLEQHPDPSASRIGEVARFLGIRGRVRAAQGRLTEALADLLECGERNQRLGFAMLGGGPWRVEAALVQAALGNTTEARRLAREQLELARAFGLARTLGASLRAAGLVEGGTRGLELLAEAVQTLEHSPSPLELARALTDHGGALRRAGQRGGARAQLERGLDLAHHLGARRIANQARAELIAAGAKPRRDAITGRDALTAGELRVARLAAEGLTNREVAQALFITTMTAKGHLSRVYRKLGITRRGQLAPALAGRLGDAVGKPSAGAAGIS